MGAKVLFIDVPPDGGANGPDDLIAMAGDKALLALLDAARPFPVQAEQDAEVAVAALSDTCDIKTRDQALNAIARVADPSHQLVLAGRAAKALAERAKKGVELEVGKKAKALREDRNRAQETVRHERLLRMKIEPAALIEELAHFFEKRMHLRPGVALILALYALNTWCFDLFESVPYLLVCSPVARCGKTRLMGLLEAVCARARGWVSVSGASMFRTIELYKPTLLIDQVEKLATVDESSRELIAILDSGYKKGARVPRMIGKNHDILVEFSVYCPKVLACVDKLKGALMDRCIVFELERRPRGKKPKSARIKAIAVTAERLREMCEAYAVQWEAKLIQLYDSEPDEGYWPGLDDREQELFGPLLLHSRIAGIEGPALTLAEGLSRCKLDIQSQEQDFLLARELCDVLVTKFKGEQFSSKALLPYLKEKESWGNRFAFAKNDHAASTSVGTFVGRFHLESRKHGSSGTTYTAAEAIEKIAYYIQDSGVTGVSDSEAHLKSEARLDDTSQEAEVCDQKGVSSQHTSSQQFGARPTPMTCQIADVEGQRSGPEISAQKQDEAENVDRTETPATQEDRGDNGNAQNSDTPVIEGVMEF